MTGYWSEASAILMEKRICDQSMARFEQLQTDIKAITLANFEGKPVRQNGSYGCDCPSNKVFVGGNPVLGVDHAYRMEGEKGNKKPVRVLTGEPMLRRVHNYYEHCTVDGHLLDFMRRFPNLIDLSSWVLEAANKIWKQILLTQVSNKGWNKQDVDSKDHPAFQALKRFMRVVHPSRRRFSVRDQRDRILYTCSVCDQPKLKGHLKANPRCREEFARQRQDAHAEGKGLRPEGQPRRARARM